MKKLIIVLVLFVLVGCSSPQTTPEPVPQPEQSLILESLLAEAELMHGHIEHWSGQFKDLLLDGDWDLAEVALGNLRIYHAGFTDVCFLAAEIAAKHDDVRVQEAATLLRALIPILDQKMEEFSNLLEEGRNR